MSPTVRGFFRRFPDDGTCPRHPFDVRFGQGHARPSRKRAAQRHRIEKEPAFPRRWRGRHAHPVAGTLLEGTRTPLQGRLHAIRPFTTSRRGVPAEEPQRRLGATCRTARRMGHGIRKRVAAAGGDAPSGGRAEADGTRTGGVDKGAGRGRGPDNEAVPFGTAERGGDAATKVNGEADGGALPRGIGRGVPRGTTIRTGAHGGCRGLKGRGPASLGP